MSLRGLAPTHLEAAIDQGGTYARRGCRLREPLANGTA